LEYVQHLTIYDNVGDGKHCTERTYYGHALTTTLVMGDSCRSLIQIDNSVVAVEIEMCTGVQSIWKGSPGRR